MSTLFSRLALREHLKILLFALNEQLSELKEMEMLFRGDADNNCAWSEAVFSHGKLSKCIQIYLQWRRPTYMHIIIVSRLSEWYRWTVLAARNVHNTKLYKEALFNSTLARKSAKYLAYAMIGECSNDICTQDWCFKASDAFHRLIKSNEQSRFYYIQEAENRFVDHSLVHTKKMEEAIRIGFTRLGSAHSLMARHYKIIAAITVYGLCERKGFNSNVTEALGVDILPSYAKLLESAENYHDDARADPLVSVVLAHARFVDAYSNENHAHALHIVHCVQNYMRSFDLAVPQLTDCTFEVDLPHQLWTRVLSASSVPLSKKLADYASQMQQNLQFCGSRSLLCCEIAVKQTTNNKPTCAELRSSIACMLQDLFIDIMQSARFLRDSLDGMECADWSYYEERVDDTKKWLEMASVLETTYEQLDLCNAHWSHCKRMSPAPPTSVGETLDMLWEHAKSCYANLLAELETTIASDSVSMSPSRAEFYWKGKYDAVSRRARIYLLRAHALQTEVQQLTIGACHAQFHGATEVEEAYVKLAVLAALYCSANNVSVSSALTEEQVLQHLPFSNEELQVLKTTSDMLKEATSYHTRFSHEQDTSALWRKVYNQQMLVVESSMLGRQHLAPKTLISCLIKRIGNPSEAFLDILLDIWCGLSHSLFTSEGNALMWQQRANDTCCRICKILSANVERYTPEVLSALVSHYECAVLCYKILADANASDKNKADPLLTCAEFLTDTEMNPSNCGRSRNIARLSWNAAVARGILFDSPHSSVLAELLSVPYFVLDSVLSELAAVTVAWYKHSAEVFTALQTVTGTESSLWYKVRGSLDEQRLFMDQYVVGKTTQPDITTNLFGYVDDYDEEKEYDDLKVKSLRLLEAARAFAKGDTVMSHCYKMASIGDYERKKSRHAECTKKYLDIIEALPCEDKELLSLKVEAADKFRELTDKNDDVLRSESALMLYSDAAESRLAAYVVGSKCENDKQVLLKQASEYFTQAADALCASGRCCGQLKDTHAIELAKRANDILVSFGYPMGLYARKVSSKKNTWKGKKHKK